MLAKAGIGGAKRRPKGDGGAAGVKELATNLEPLVHRRIASSPVIHRDDWPINWNSLVYHLNQGEISAGQSFEVGFDLFYIPIPPFEIQEVGNEFVVKTLTDYPARIACGHRIRRNIGSHD